jgi:TPR repeat protein
MFNLGVLYHNGQGVAQDHAKAREWYEKAAAKGDASAMFNLGVLYDNGFGVAKDYAKAREWYEKAAARGHARARAHLEQMPVR